MVYSIDLATNGRRKVRQVLTFASTFKLLGVLRGASCLLLLFLALSALVEVFDDDADEHVEYEERDEQQKRDEVQQPPLVMIHLRLNANKQCAAIKVDRRQLHTLHCRVADFGEQRL